MPSTGWLQRLPAIHGPNVAKPVFTASRSGRVERLVTEGPVRPVPTARVLSDRPTPRVGKPEP